MSCFLVGLKIQAQVLSQNVFAWQQVLFAFLETFTCYKHIGAGQSLFSWSVLWSSWPSRSGGFRCLSRWRCWESLKCLRTLISLLLLLAAHHPLIGADRTTWMGLGWHMEPSPIQTSHSSKGQIGHKRAGEENSSRLNLLQQPGKCFNFLLLWLDFFSTEWCNTRSLL